MYHSSRSTGRPSLAHSRSVACALAARTFSTLARLKDEREARRTHAEELRRADPTRAAAPFFLGEAVKVLDTELSPDDPLSQALRGIEGVYQ